jgi:hypothetical protein
MLGLTEMTKKKGEKPSRCSIRRLVVKMGTKYGCTMIRIVRIVDDETVLCIVDDEKTGGCQVRTEGTDDSALGRGGR